jgi:uncharacterized membrane protein
LSGPVMDIIAITIGLFRGLFYSEGCFDYFWDSETETIHHSKGNSKSFHLVILSLQ